MKQNIGRSFLLIGFFLLIVSCAQTAPVEACVEGDPAGFWKGLWHGIIVIISFIIGLFKDDVAVYAVNNTGGWYDFGFILGILIMGGGSGRASSKNRC